MVMKVFIIVALLPSGLAAAASECGTSICEDDISLVQVKKIVEHRHERSNGIPKLPDHFYENSKGAFAQKPVVNLESLASKSSAKTFVSSVGGNPWWFWFKHAQNNAEWNQYAVDKAVQNNAEANVWANNHIADADAWANNNNAEANIWAANHLSGGGLGWRHVLGNAGDWVPSEWLGARREPWNNILGSAIANGHRWNDYAMGLNSRPSWTGNWQVAAALPVDPSLALDINPEDSDITSLESDVDLQALATDNYNDARALTGSAAAEDMAVDEASELR